MSMKAPAWLDYAEDDVYRFVSLLRKPTGMGRFLPCPHGATTYGKGAELGFSCFALKLYYLFGWWDSRLSRRDRFEWIEFIQSFQTQDLTAPKVSEGAYVDQVLANFLRNPSLRRYITRLRSTSLKDLLRSVYPGQFLSSSERAVIAETKQVIATLAEIREKTRQPYTGFCQLPNEVDDYMASFDWSLPWSAGGQTAALAVFLSVEAPRLMPDVKVLTLKQAARSFYRSIADPTSGGYFIGKRPNQDMLVNGAMKVLTALDWLGEEIHYPTELIDTTLHKLPRPDGCHVVDAVYVLYRCALQTNYRRSAIETYLQECLCMISQHTRADGGFSYHTNRSQKWYYGLPITKGLKEGDLHGTILLVWAVTMCTAVLYPGMLSWKVLRP